MGLFDKIKEPIVLKEDSSARAQLRELEEFLLRAEDPKIRSALESDIAAVKAGIFGEDTILFELKNSHIPMFILQDVYLEHEGLTAQIDFLIVTRRRIFVVECKNLYGNITINNAGDFVRIMGKRREGLYSPVTQSKRHLELIKKIRAEEQTNFLTKALLERNFYENYRSVVVLANPKTVLDARYAPKDVKAQVIRADQLSAHIHKVNSEKDAAIYTENEMEQRARFFLAAHRECQTDYLKKYRSVVPAEQAPFNVPAVPEASPLCPAAPSATKNAEVPLCPKCGEPMIRRKATRGDNAGQEFWGCSKYPKCRGIVNIR